MKICVVGSGGVGGYFGAKLAKAGHDVTFLARGAHYDAIKAKGLLVKSTDGNFQVDNVKVVNSIKDFVNPELVLFCVKTYDTDFAAQELASVVSLNTVILTFQKGIENDFELKKYLTKGEVYPGIAYIISQISEPGVISNTGGLKKLIFGDRSYANNVKLKTIELLMRDSFINATLSDDINRDLWKKYVFILAFAGMTAICRSNIGKILKDKTTFKLYKDCMQEALNVASILKINLPRTIYDDTLKTTIDTQPESKSSLLHDIENNKQTEIETLHGTLVRIAKERKILVPINELIYGSVRLWSQK